MTSKGNSSVLFIMSMPHPPGCHFLKVGPYSAILQCNLSIGIIGLYFRAIVNDVKFSHVALASLEYPRKLCGSPHLRRVMSVTSTLRTSRQWCDARITFNGDTGEAGLTGLIVRIRTGGVSIPVRARRGKVLCCGVMTVQTDHALITDRRENPLTNLSDGITLGQ